VSARLSAIRVCIHHADLVRDDACAEGVQLFDRIAAEGASADVLEFQWSPLASVWLAVVARDYMPWLRERSYVPSSANLSSANLYGANLSVADLRSADLSSADLTFALRAIDDDPIAGWIVKNGRLEKVLS
jgi:uncharacterized protein YjbI with pentapeptide repeats